MYKRQTLGNGFKKGNGTLDNTPGGTNEKTEIKEDPSTLLHQNKGSKNKEKSKHIGINSRGIRKKQIIKKTKKIKGVYNQASIKKYYDDQQ